MDLSKFNMSVMAERGADLELEHPATGETLMQDDGETPVTITLLGQDSKAWRNKNREYQQKRIAALAKRRKKTIDYTVSDEDACEMLAECTIGWAGIEEEGETLEFSKDAAFDLYMKYPWIREQCDEFIGDRANFFPSE